MKLLLPFLLITFMSYSQERTTDSGTTFHYKVQEGKILYKLDGTIRHWDDDSIVIDWKTSKPKSTAGSFTMNFGSIGESNAVQIKYSPGHTVLDNDVCGWVLPYPLFDSLFNLQMQVTNFIDGQWTKLDPVKVESKHAIKYDGKTQKVLYAEGYNDMEGADKIKLGFIEYMNDILIVAKYMNGDYSMTLTSINSPGK